jgi:tetratricopeptide (TPR) repeat protein
VSGGETDSAAFVNMGMLFLNGYGTFANPRRALRYFERASLLGNCCVDDRIVHLRGSLAGKPGYMSCEAHILKLPPEVRAKFASFQKLREPAQVMRAYVNLELVPFCASISPYGKRLALAFFKWRVGVELLHRGDGVAALKSMAEALGIDSIMCPSMEGMQQKLDETCQSVLAKDPKSRDALFLLAHSVLNRSHRWMSLGDHALKLFPNDSALIYMHASALSFEKDHYADAETAFSRAVKLFPDDADFRYGWATALRFCEREAEAIPQFLEFLRLAPVDHRKRPNALYQLALQHYENDAALCEKFIREGQEAEKRQLPAFVPVRCTEKFMLHALGLLELDVSTSEFKPGVRRSRLIKRFREENRKWADLVNGNKKLAVSEQIGKPQSESRGPPVWDSLEPIVLLDFVPMEDKVHEGCVIELTVISPPVRQVAIHVLVQDLNLDVEPMSIYCPPDFEIQQGDRLMLARPYQRMSRDMRSMIRVDDLKTLRIVGHENICSYCCKPSPKLSRCAKCKVALYCCADHQKRDWEELAHKIECRPK